MVDGHILEISCEDAIRQISAYIDDGLSPELRARIEAHVRACKHCAAVLNGTTNTIQLLADGRILDLPEGFSLRLQARLAAHLAAE